MRAASVQAATARTFGWRRSPCATVMMSFNQSYQAPCSLPCCSIAHGSSNPTFDDAPLITSSTHANRSRLWLRLRRRRLWRWRVSRRAGRNERWRGRAGRGPGHGRQAPDAAHGPHLGTCLVLRCVLVVLPVVVLHQHHGAVGVGPRQADERGSKVGGMYGRQGVVGGEGRDARYS